jgi:DNA-binding NarL/FixJ family response regulator
VGDNLSMPHRILIADPSKTVRLAAQMVFAKSQDIVLVTALNAFEALDKMHLIKPTLTLMDPDLANQLCTSLKRLPGPMLVLEKPFTSAGLYAQVRNALLSLFPEGHEQCSGSNQSEQNIHANG